MDNALTPKEKKKIYEDLFDLSFYQLKIKKITVDEGQEIASDILDNVENLKNREDFLVFLEKLAKKWAFFSNYFLKNKGEKEVEKDKEKIEELTKKLNSFIN
ncbi:hypothetical protein H3C65_02065 [Patescibacteria group bacterium]|nr:hypothetical protein [Patescibacteria group bacterium]